MSRNQTATFLKRRFEEVGIRLHPRHGQNFLIDLNLQRLLVEAAGLGPQDVVLEVGTGTGSLTALMAPLVAAVVTVEIDPRLHQLASEELIDCDNVTQLLTDVLATKNRLSPEVMETVRSRLAESPDRVFKLAANLPYCVATPVISNLLAADPTPATLTVTIQKELADRIVAAPSTKDYGALSLWVQSQCRAEILRVLPPQVFWPRPKVHSAIIQIRRDPALFARIADPAFFHDFVRRLFLHRRKFLRGVMRSAFKGQLSKDDVDAILAERQLGETTRAEQLDVEAMLALSDSVRLRLAA